MKKIYYPVKQNVLLITVLAACLAWSVVPVSAHTSRTDGVISAEVHIDPADRPKAGTSTSLHFEFYDEANLFTLTRCDCRLLIQENGTDVATLPLGGTDLLVSENTFTFPKAGDYTLQVSGQPKDSATFQSFLLAYPLEVLAKESPTSATAEPKRSQSSPVILWTGLVVAGLVAAIVIYTIVHVRRNRQAAPINSRGNNKS